MFKNISKAIWFVWMPIIPLALSTIYMLIVGIIPLYYLFATLIMWCLVCGLGVAVGYHRVFSHRTHQLRTYKENIILFFASFAGQGSSIVWAALHRGYHHPYADTPKDIHSPVVYGVFESFVGWYRNVTENNMIINVKYAVDLLRRPNHVWFHKHQLTILWSVPLFICLFDWRLAFCGFFLVTGISLCQDNMINVLGHLKGIIGYRNFETKDNSYNNPVLGFLTWGQGWHNNHHHSPASYDFGSGVSGKWWEFDPCKIFLPFLK
jgi:stearoyl-CoA desaturase (delta-9 desaturase)